MKMTHHQFAAGLIAAALAFRQSADDAVETARLRAITHEEEEPFPAEIDEEDLWEHFQSFIELRGIRVDNINPDIACFAGLQEGEPSFTLRGQDILASMFVRHWVSIYEGLAPAPNMTKVADAEVIAERMEMYSKQKWAD